MIERNEKENLLGQMESDIKEMEKREAAWRRSNI